MPVPTEIASNPAAAAVPPVHGFPRAHRLLRRSEFVRVQQQGRRVHTAHFVMLVLRARGPDSATRLGVTVGRRVGGAVQRNRVKRLVREVFRRNRALFPRDCDVVLVARPGADRLDYATVLSELERAQTAIERAVRQLAAQPPPSSSDS
jgi:ribonuclease P protein component